MITGIQQRVPENGVYPFAGDSKLAANDATLKPLGAGSNEDNAPVLFRQDRVDIARTGFGEGTVSTPTAVIRTLNRGLQSARKVIPTTEELRDDIRRQASFRREAASREALKAGAVKFDALTVSNATQQAVDQARSVVNAANEAAGAAQARIAGEPAQSEDNAATVQINGQSIRYLDAQASLGPAPTPSLNLLA